MARETAAPSNISALMERMNACLTNPGSQSVGSFAATLQALQAELALMADQPLTGDGGEADVLDWDEILAQSGADDDVDAAGFTPEQLSMLSQ